MNYERLLEALKRHEGLKLKAYRCTSGKLTIGFGRNLEDKGISESEAEIMLMNDIQEFQSKLKNFKWFNQLSDARKEVIINMAFNLGLGGLLKFKKTIELIEQKDFEGASKQMLESRWASQVGKRAKELSDQFLKG